MNQDEKPGASQNGDHVDDNWRNVAESWEYEQIVDEAVPALIQNPSFESVQILADALERSVAQQQKFGPEGVWRDGSEAWRPSVADHEQNRRDDARDRLIEGLRDSALAFAQENPDRVPELVESLESRGWAIFHRIALFVLAELDDPPGDLIEDRLTDERLREPHFVRVEYNRLLSNSFVDLEDAIRDDVVDALRSSFDPDLFREWVENQHNREPTEAEIEKAEMREKVRRLAPIAEFLPADLGEEYEDWVEQVGEPDLPDFPIRTSPGFVGPKTPPEAERLGTLDDEGIIEFLKEWEPPEDPMERFHQSPRGLARKLEGLVEEDSDRFANLADRFEELEPGYAAALFRGLRSAVRNGDSIPWEPVISLGEKIIEQELEDLDEESHPLDIETSWSEVWKPLASLIDTGAAQDSSGLEVEQGAVWGLLETMCKQVVEESAPRHGVRSRDPLTVAINTLEGALLQAVLRYARRHKRSNDAGADEPYLTESLSEVQEVIEGFIDFSEEARPDLRAIFGAFLGILYNLDAQWTEDHIAEIFQVGDVPYSTDPAWRTFIVYGSPHRVFFDLLGDYYQEAAEEPPPEDDPGRASEYVRQYVNHLVPYFGSCWIDLDHPMLGSFFRESTDGVRAVFANRLGRLAGKDEELPDGWYEKCREFWGQRRAEAEEDPGDLEEEMKAFGWWFRSGAFDDEWALNQLEWVISRYGTVDGDLGLAESLGALSDEFPGKTLSILEEWLLENEARGLAFRTDSDHIQRILRNCLESDDEELQADAEATVSRIASRGFTEYRELIS